MSDLNKNIRNALVPWFNTHEWMLVYNLLYANQINSTRKTKALEILKLWKARTPLLPAGVEGTLIILQVIEPTFSETVSEHELQMLYSTAILRFLNISAAHDNKQGTFFTTAKKMDIPNWLIDIRHDIAHGANLPSLEILRKACDFAMNWLYTKYWFPVSTEISDYVNKENPTENLKTNDEKLHFIVNVLECITLCQHPKFNLNTIQDIPDENSIKTLMEGLTALSKFKTLTSETSLIFVSNSLVSYLEKYLQGKQFDKCSSFIDILLGGDTFMCEENLALQLFEDKNFKKLSWSFVNLWRNLLSFIHRSKLLEQLLLKLVHITADEEEIEHRRKVAALWMVVLCKGLQKIKLMQFYLNNSKEKSNFSMMNPAEISAKLKAKIENNMIFRKVIDLYLFGEIPQLLTNFNYLQKVILSGPSKYTNIFLPEAINLVTPPFTPEMKSNLLHLVKLYTQPESVDLPTAEYIPSLVDLQKLMSEKLAKGDSEEVSLQQTSSVKKTSRKSFSQDGQFLNGDWSHGISNSNYSTTPLGLLPWQASTFNPSLPKLDL